MAKAKTKKSVKVSAPKKNNGMHLYQGTEVFLAREARPTDWGFDEKIKNPVVIKFPDGSRKIVSTSELELA